MTFKTKFTLLVAMIFPFANAHAAPQNTFAQDVEVLNKIDGSEVLEIEVPKSQS